MILKFWNPDMGWVWIDNVMRCSSEEVWIKRAAKEGQEDCFGVVFCENPDQEGRRPQPEDEDEVPPPPPYVQVAPNVSEAALQGVGLHAVSHAKLIRIWRATDHPDGELRILLVNTPAYLLNDEGVNVDKLTGYTGGM